MSEHECEKCHRDFTVPFDMEPTDYCNTCAQDLCIGLLDRIKVLEVELERRNRELLNSPADIQELVIKKLNLVSAEAITQRDNALKLVGGALLLFKPSKHQWAQHMRALAAIKACGVEL